MKYYKNKLRYLIARYGYSTNIAAFETINESNGVCSKVKYQYDVTEDDCNRLDITHERPYSATDGTQTAFRNNMNIWQGEMINFMNVNMGHDQHLTSVNYLTEGLEIADDTTYYLNNLDIITQQQYGNFPDIYSSSVDFVNDLHDNENAQINNYPLCDKPVMHGEFGSWDPDSQCDNDATWIRDLWIGSFTGICGSALLWDNQHSRELWPHFGRLRAFMAGYNFDESEGKQKGWIPFHDYDKMHYENWVRKPGIVDLLYLRSPDKKRAVGILANRTYNFYTQWNVAKCEEFVWTGDDNGGLPIPDDQEKFELTWEDDDSWNDSAYNDPKTAYHINEAVGVAVKKLKTYTVTYIDPFTLHEVATQNKYNVSGKLNLDFPYLTGSKTRPFLLVKIEPKNNKNPEEYTDSVQKNLDKLAYETQEKLSSITKNSNARIYPNPADDFVMVELPTNMTSCKIDLLSCSGTVIKSENFTDPLFKFYFSEISTGIYILRLYYNQKVETFKLSVQ